MGRYIILTALILGLIGAVSAQSFGLTTRSKYPVTAIDGCKPGALAVTMCPVRTECFRDAQFKNGGRCDCKYSMLMTGRLHPMKNPEPLCLCPQATLSFGRCQKVFPSILIRNGTMASPQRTVNRITFQCSLQTACGFFPSSWPGPSYILTSSFCGS